MYRLRERLLRNTRNSEVMGEIRTADTAHEAERKSRNE